MRATTDSRRSYVLAALAAGLVAACALLAGSSALAQTESGLSSEIERAREDAQALAASVQARSDELAAARDQAIAAAERELELTRVLDEARERARELGEELIEAEAELSAARERLLRARTALADRLIAIYKSTDPDSMTLLLDAEGYDDLATRAEYLQRIEEADSRLASRAAELRVAAAEARDAVTEAKEAADAHEAAVADARREISAVRAAAEARSAELAAARERQTAELRELRGRISSLIAELQELRALNAVQARDQVAAWFGDWAIPTAIVMCESGGNYGALNSSSGAGGAYQIMPSTWAAYGGEGDPHTAPKAEQDRIAALIWRDSGPGAWVCQA